MIHSQQRIGSVIGSVVGGSPRIGTLPEMIQKPASNTITPTSRPKELDLPRALNYYADFSGCGFWRMIWPEHTLNAYSKAIIHGSTVMVSDQKYYVNVKCVRVQRSCVPEPMVLENRPRFRSFIGVMQQ